MTDTDRHALPLLAADADTAIQRKVATHHGDLAHRLGAVADQSRALDGGGDLAILDEVGLGGGEDKLAGGDVHLTAAEVGGIDALLHRGDDLGRIVLTRQHVGVGHAGHRHGGVGFAATVASERPPHQTGILLVLQVTLEDAVLDQHVIATRRPLVIDGDGATPTRQGAVIDDSAVLGGHLLADATGKRGRALAVEVPLQTVTYCLVQQHAGPAGAQHHRHGTGRCIDGVEADQRLTHRFAHITKGAALQPVQFEEPVVTKAATATGTAALATIALLGNHGHRQPYQRANIGSQGTVGRSNQHLFIDAADGGHHLIDGGIQTSGKLVHLLQQGDLLLLVEGLQRIHGRIEQVRFGARPCLHLAVSTGSGDATGGSHRLLQRQQAQLVRVGEAGLLAADGAYPDPLIDVVAAILDDAIFQHPGLVPAALEIEVTELHLMAHQAAEQLLQAPFVEVVGGQQGGTNLAQ